MHTCKPGWAGAQTIQQSTGTAERFKLGQRQVALIFLWAPPRIWQAQAQSLQHRYWGYTCPRQKSTFDQPQLLWLLFLLALFAQVLKDSKLRAGMQNWAAEKQSPVLSIAAVLLITDMACFTWGAFTHSNKCACSSVVLTHGFKGEVTFLLSELAHFQLGCLSSHTFSFSIQGYTRLCSLTSSCGPEITHCYVGDPLQQNHVTSS